MKVVFVYPAFENLGLEYLSASLRRAGHETALVFDPALFDDGFFQAPPLAHLLDEGERLAARIVEHRPDVIAFGVMTPIFQWALRLARRVRAKGETAPIVFGGIHPTTVPERVLRHPEVDLVVRGEGEAAFVELVDALATGGAPDSIENVALRDPTAPGGVRVNPLRPLVQDLDTLPFPDKEFFLAEARLFRRGYAIMTERGCSYSCSFCHHYNGKRLYGVSNATYVRRRSVDNVLEELRQATARFDPGMVRFEDETFTSDWPWVEELCERYRREIGLPFFCLGRPDTIHEDLIRTLVAAGCRDLEVGVQSFDAGIRKRVAYRNESDAEVHRTLALCREHGLHLDVDIILNLPGQKEAQLLEALEVLVDGRPATVNAFSTAYFPGTGVLEIARAEGLVDDAEVERILDGESCERPTQGGHGVAPSVAKLGLLMSLVPHVPPGLIRWLARDGRYRWLPHVGFTSTLVVVALVGILRRWLVPGTEHVEKFEAVRTPDRYVTYLVRRWRPRFRAGGDEATRRTRPAWAGAAAS